MKKSQQEVSLIQDRLKRLLKETTFQPIDFSLGSLVDMLQEDAIKLNPDFQRRERWDKKKQSKLIESFLLNVPIPPVFIIGREELGKFNVIDGQQRLRAISEFFNDQFKLTKLEKWTELNGMKYRDLAEIGLASQLSQRPLRTFELRTTNPEATIDIFSRLNTGGILLNLQELRNSVFSDYKFNDLIKKLGDNEKFLQMIGIKSKKDKKYRSMTNCEFVLRYFAVRNDGYKDFKHLYDPFLNGAMRAKKSMTEDEGIQLTNSFSRTIDSIYVGLGKTAFKNPLDPKSNFSSAIYDATVYAFDDRDPELVSKYSGKIRDANKRLWGRQEYKGLYGKGTNTPVRMEKRLLGMKDMVDAVLGA